MKIIKLLGGYTEVEYDVLKAKHHNEINKLKKQTFRVGDLVYINGDSLFNPKHQYYLLESYNNLNCWYVSLDKNDNRRFEVENGISYDKLSHNKPKSCYCCGGLLNDK